MNTEDVAKIVDAVLNQKKNVSANSPSSSTGKAPSQAHDVVAVDFAKAKQPDGSERQFWSLRLEKKNAKLGQQSRLYGKAIFEDTHSVLYTKILQMYDKLREKDNPMEELAKTINQQGGIYGSENTVFLKDQHGQDMFYWPWDRENDRPLRPDPDDPNKPAESSKTNKLTFFLLEDEDIPTATRNALRRISEHLVDESQSFEGAQIDAASGDILDDANEPDKSEKSNEPPAPPKVK